MTATPPLDHFVRDYHGRPARVLMADRFTSALLATTTDPALLSLPLIGGIDQAIDSSDIFRAPEQYRRLGALYPALVDKVQGGTCKPLAQRTH